MTFMPEDTCDPIAYGTWYGAFLSKTRLFMGQFFHVIRSVPHAYASRFSIKDHLRDTECGQLVSFALISVIGFFTLTFQSE